VEVLSHDGGDGRQTTLHALKEAARGGERGNERERR
jgi:hypothetical protein